MSAAQAIQAARAVGIHLEVEGADLLMEAPMSPPTAVLDALSRHKTEIVAMLRCGPDGWSTEDWRLFFEERAATAEFDGGLPRNKAEARAFECCIIEWLNRNLAPSVSGTCAWCGRSENHDAVVLPYGTEPGPHIWLHAHCWTEWWEMRRSQSRDAPSSVGISGLSDNCIVPAASSHPSNEQK
jgi:hypothetical protein